MNGWMNEFLSALIEIAIMYADDECLYNIDYKLASSKLQPIKTLVIRASISFSHALEISRRRVLKRV